MWYNEDEEVDEAEYGGRKVKLGKPMRGDVKKFKVYVKNPKGNVVKVNFVIPNMKLKVPPQDAEVSQDTTVIILDPDIRHVTGLRKW